MKEFIEPYTSPIDWNYLLENIPCSGVKCGASRHYFVVGHDGKITTCATNQVVGDFFNGDLIRTDSVCGQPKEFPCNCIIAYCQRYDNPLLPVRHIEDYVKRNTAYRRKTGVL